MNNYAFSHICNKQLKIDETPLMIIKNHISYRKLPLIFLNTLFILIRDFHFSTKNAIGKTLD